MDMENQKKETEIDHHEVHGLASGIESIKITNPYQSKAKLPHPDKRPNNDPNDAKAVLQEFLSSYEKRRRRNRLYDNCSELGKLIIADGLTRCVTIGFGGPAAVATAPGWVTTAVFLGCYFTLEGGIWVYKGYSDPNRSAGESKERVDDQDIDEDWVML